MFGGEVVPLFMCLDLVVFLPDDCQMGQFVFDHDQVFLYELGERSVCSDAGQFVVGSPILFMVAVKVFQWVRNSPGRRGELEAQQQDLMFFQGELAAG